MLSWKLRDPPPVGSLSLPPNIYAWSFWSVRNTSASHMKEAAMSRAVTLRVFSAFICLKLVLPRASRVWFVASYNAYYALHVEKNHLQSQSITFVLNSI